MREQGTIHAEVPFPNRNLVKGETDLYVPNLHPHRRIPAKEEEPEIYELTNRDQGHRTLADCFYKYKGRETGDLHSNAQIINENLNPHFVKRNIYMDHALLEGTHQEIQPKPPVQIFPRVGIQSQMRRNMNEKLLKESANSKLLGNHIMELGGVEDTIGSKFLSLTLVMEESLRNNELKFIGYQKDIRNVLELDEEDNQLSDHPYYSQNHQNHQKQKCKEVYDPFQYKDPYFRYKYNEPQYDVVGGCEEKKKEEPCGYYSTVSHGFPYDNQRF